MLNCRVPTENVHKLKSLHSDYVHEYLSEIIMYIKRKHLDSYLWGLYYKDQFKLTY